MRGKSNVPGDWQASKLCAQVDPFEVESDVSGFCSKLFQGYRLNGMKNSVRSFLGNAWMIINVLVGQLHSSWENTEHVGCISHKFRTNSPRPILKSFQFRHFAESLLPSCIQAAFSSQDLRWPGVICLLNSAQSYGSCNVRFPQLFLFPNQNYMLTCDRKTCSRVLMILECVHINVIIFF